MNVEIIILILVIFLGFFALFVFINLKLKSLLKSVEDNEAQKVLVEWLNQMRSSLDKNTETLQEQLVLQSKDLNERLDTAARVIGEVKRELGTMSEIGRSMKSLQDFLRSPKLRGNIGEQILNDLLSQMLPSENYYIQYEFKNNQKVDAVLKTDEGLIPVDSKFPMENFKALIQAESDAERERIRKTFTRDVKKHIDKIAKSYILPDEGTVDFALMYVPSEAIYYEIVVNTPDIGRYSWKKRVLPVSPNVFYSFLKAVLIGLEGKRVEAQVKVVVQAIRSLQGDSEKFGDTLRLLSKHVTNAKNVSDEATSEYGLLRNKINSLNQIAVQKGKSELHE